MFYGFNTTFLILYLTVFIFTQCSAGREVTVADLFDRFPSLRLSFTAFYQFAPLNAPRYYTVSSSRRFSPKTVSLTLGLKKRETQPVPRCSSYLATLEPGRDAIRASFFHSSFVFPAQDRHPILLVSAGTGIAPFRAFMQDLEHERADEQLLTMSSAVSTSGRHSAVAVEDREEDGGAHRNAYLFYGCRSPEVDFLYSDEMQRAFEAQVLDQLHVVFSSAKNQPKRVGGVLCIEIELMGSC